MVKLECPVCRVDIDVEEPVAGEVTWCDFCDATLGIQRKGRGWVLVELEEEEEEEEKW